jgi:hypothetical protein
MFYERAAALGELAGRLRDLGLCLGSAAKFSPANRGNYAKNSASRPKTDRLHRENSFDIKGSRNCHHYLAAVSSSGKAGEVAEEI